MSRRICFLLQAFLLAAVFASAATKEEYNRLARLSYIEGNVGYQHAADVDWSAASVNMPLEPGDRIYTGQDGRAEIEFEDGSIYRIARNTDVEILSLREERIQLRILVGLSTLIVGSDTDFEINTPAAAFTALRKGTYRFGVNDNGDSDAIARKGELEAANNHFSRRIQAGEMIQVAVNGEENPRYSRYDRRDEWDEWNDRRNADMNAYAGKRYLPSSVSIGVYDLHRHGRWINVESYGIAWVPAGISVSWAPYSVGRWCYRPFYGWTWISSEPWGWLPYHYGRWYRSSRYGWCWLPGPSFAFNFWAPALVTFYSGPGWISWCPLGPGDYYNINRYHYNRRIHGHQLAQLRNLHTRAPGNPFHRGNRDAFRTVDTDHFRNGSFGDGGREAKFRNVEQPWRQGNVIHDRLPVEPTAASFRPAPDRHAAGPTRTAKPLQAVVRNSPDGNLRGQEQFRRITSPEIPALPPRAERRQTEQQPRPAQENELKTNARIAETPERARANIGVTNLQRSESTDQSGRRVTTYRYAGENRAEERTLPLREAQTSRSRVDSEPRGHSSVPSETPVQEQRRAQPSPSRVTPRVEEYQRPNDHIEQRSITAGRSFVGNSGNSEPPQTEGYRTFTTPPSGREPVYSAPKAVNPPSYAAPRIEQAPGYASPRQSESSAGRESVRRSYSTPSQSRSGGNPGPPSSGRAERKSSSGSSSGGPARARDRK